MYAQLKLEERAGLISNIQVQDHIYLTEARILYIADFKVFDKKLKQDIWVEFKGFETDVWRIKRRLWQYYGPGLLRVFRKMGQRISLKEEIHSALHVTMNNAPVK